MGTEVGVAVGVGSRVGVGVDVGSGVAVKVGIGVKVGAIVTGTACTAIVGSGVEGTSVAVGGGSVATAS